MAGGQRREHPSCHPGELNAAQGTGTAPHRRCRAQYLGVHLIPSRRTRRHSPQPAAHPPRGPYCPPFRGRPSPVPALRCRSAPRRTAGAPPTAAARGRGCPGCPPLGSGGAPSPPPRPPHSPRPARPRPRSRAPARSARIKVTPPRSPLRGAGRLRGPGRRSC